MDNSNKRHKEREMFETSFQRPRDYFHLSANEQWAIDKRLGILDWEGLYLTDEDKDRMKNYYGAPPILKEPPKESYCCRSELQEKMKCWTCSTCSVIVAYKGG